MRRRKELHNFVVQDFALSKVVPYLRCRNVRWAAGIDPVHDLDRCARARVNGLNRARLKASTFGCELRVTGSDRMDRVAYLRLQKHIGQSGSSRNLLRPLQGALEFGGRL